jgi:chromosome segregation ATPase
MRNWDELRDKMLSLPALERRMEQLLNMKREAQDAVDILRHAHKKQAKNVERLEESTLSGFFLRLFDRYEAKLEQEYQVKIRAKLEYDKAWAHLQSIDADRHALGSRLTEIKRYRALYEKEMAARRENLAKCTSSQGQVLAEIEQECAELVTEATRLQSARSATRRIVSTAKAAMDSLAGAKDWATWDVFSSGIITHVMKYSHVDDAEKHINKLSSQLRELAAVDVSDIKIEGVQEISKNQRAIDFWFDNIFTDLSVRGKIINNANEVKGVLMKTERLHNRLEKRLVAVKAALAANRRREEAFIASL